MELFTVTAVLKRPDNGHSLQRTADVPAKSREGVEVAAEHWMRQGGYSGYRVHRIISIEAKQ